MIQTNFIEAIERSLKKHSELAAFSSYHGVSYSYEEAAIKIMELHKIFKSLRIGKEAKIALLGRNSAHWAIVYLATITYGAVIVPILPDFSAEDIHHIVNHSDSVLLFAADEIYKNLDPAHMSKLKAIFSLNSLELLRTKTSTPEEFLKKIRAGKQPELKDLRFPKIPNDKLESIVYTSGTTGFSKGVMLTHNNLMANVDFAIKHIPLKSGNRICSFLPSAHAFGCAFEFLYPFISGCHITFLDKIPSPKIILKAFDEIRPHLILSVPLVIEKIYFKRILPKLKKPLMKLLLLIPYLRSMILNKVKQSLMDAFGNHFVEIIVGGAAFNPEVENFLQKIHFPFTVGYGMTECAPLISYSPWHEYAPQSVGKIVDTLELRIDSTDPHNTPGEIQVRGENVMLGYYKNKEATVQTFTKDGWLRTGDLGIIDADGNISIKGRSKTMILGAGGQNIYPEEIEAKLDSFPFVQECLIVQRDRQLTALVYPDLDESDARHLSEREITHIMEENRQKLNKKLPRFARIVKLEIMSEEFEKTPKKSIKRYKYEL